MIFYGIISLVLLLVMAGLTYLFPQYGLRLLKAATDKFWSLLKPKIFDRNPPKIEESWRDTELSGGEWDNHTKKPKF